MKTMRDSAAKNGASWNEPYMEALLSAIAGGDKQALGELYHATQAAVYAYLLSLLRDGADARDALQDTYLGVYDAAPRYQPQGHARAWLYSIARNKAMMIFRRRRQWESAEDMEEEPAVPAGLCREERMVLSAALRTLGEQERQLVMLHAVSGFRFREIAAFMEMPLNTVLSKYHRAMKRLRYYLSEEERV